MPRKNRIHKPLSLASGLVFILLISFSFSSKSQKKFTLQVAIGYALDNNLGLKETKLSRALDDDILLQSKLNLLPNLNGTLQRSNSNGRNPSPTSGIYTNSSTSFDQGSINSQVILFSGFQKLNTIRQNKYQLLTDQSNLEKIKNDLIINVVTFYIAILSYQDLIVSGKDKLAVSKQTLDFDQKKLDAGTITEGDYLTDKAQYDIDVQNLTAYQNNLDISNTNLASLLNLDPANPFDIARPDSVDISQLKSTYDPLDVYTKASKNLPDIRTAEFNVSVYKKALDIAKGGYSPTLVLGAGYQNTYSPSYLYPNGSIISFNDQLKNNYLKSYFFTLNIPIFNGWQQHLAVKRAAYNYQKAQIDKEITKSNLNKTIVQAIIDLRAAEKSYYSSKSASESSKKAFYFSQVRYNVGLLNSLDYNLAKSKYAVAEATEIQNKYNYLFKAKVIDFYLGNTITL